MVAKKPEGEKEKPGRKSTYRPEYAERAKEMCEAGLTNEQIAENLGISRTQFYMWLKMYPVFADSLKDWKEHADKHVENALFKSSQGFYVEQEKVVSSGGKVWVEKYMEYYPPSNTAQIFWLKNRQPDKWRENKELTLKKALDPNSDPIADLAASIAALADKLVDGGGDDDE